MGGKVDTPDTSALTSAAYEANAALQAQAGLINTTAANEYASNQAFAQPIATNQVGLMNTSTAAANQLYGQSQAYYDAFNQYNQAGMAYLDNAMNYNEAAYREQLARQAAADAGLAFQTTQAANARTMASMGVNPNSGRYAGQQTMSNLGLAANKANAMTATRQQATEYGNEMLTNAYELGLPLTTASAYAANSATSATNAATSAGTNAYTVYAQPGQSYVDNLYTGGQTMNMGYNQLLNGLGGVLTAEQQAYNAQMALLGDIYTGTTSMAGSIYGKPPSDRRLKQDIERVGTYFNGLPQYEFAYRDQPEKRYRGVMADEVEQVYPEAVITAEDGFKRVDYSLLGIAMEEVTNERR